MKLAHIWYNEGEMEFVASWLQENAPDWNLTSIHEDEVSNLTQLLKLLNKGFDAILMHLSLHYCLALKAGEIAHRTNNPTKVILFSRTKVEPELLEGFFDGWIHPDRDEARIAEIIIDIVANTRKIIEDDNTLEQHIVGIFNQSSSLKTFFRAKFGARHKEHFTMEDYRWVVQQSMLRVPEVKARYSYDVFISYSTKDSAIAGEMVQILSGKGLKCFKAEDTIHAGDLWSEDIRKALIRSKIILMILTPNSSKRPWVMIEAGAAWCLQKRIIPCVSFVEFDQLPEPITRHQARPMNTQADKEKIANEIVDALN